MAKLILSMDGMVLKEIALTKERTTIGRKPHNDIQIDNLAVSGEHAVIVTILNDSFLEDLGSTNGTLVNGQPIKKHFLQSNDAIELGKYRLKYVNEAPASAKPAEFERTMVLDRSMTGANPIAPASGSAGFGGSSESVPGVSDSQPLSARLGAGVGPGLGAQPPGFAPKGPIPPLVSTGPQALVPAGAAVATSSGLSVLDSLPQPADTLGGPLSAMDFVPVREPSGAHKAARPLSGPQGLSALGLEPLAVDPALAAPPTAPLNQTGVVQILTGSNAGRELELTKPLTTLGKPQVQVAVITKRPNGYYITHVEGENHPIVNGRVIDSQATRLSDHDVIEIAGVKMEFYLK